VMSLASASTAQDSEQVIGVVAVGRVRRSWRKRDMGARMFGQQIRSCSLRTVLQSQRIRRLLFEP